MGCGRPERILLVTARQTVIRMATHRTPQIHRVVGGRKEKTPEDAAFFFEEERRAVCAGRFAEDDGRAALPAGLLADEEEAEPLLAGRDAHSPYPAGRRTGCAPC